VSPTFRGSAERQFSDLENRFFLQNIGAPTTFGEFLTQPRATPAALRGQLGFIRDILAQGAEGSRGTTEQRASILGRFGTAGDPFQDLARQAIIQPGLATVAPAFRGAFGRGAEQIFNRQRALNPEESFFDFGKRRGFF